MHRSLSGCRVRTTNQGGTRLGMSTPPSPAAGAGEMTQRTFFDDFDRADRVQPVDPNLDVSATARVSRQSAEILARLQRGRASNRELVGIAQRFGARIHDLRTAGHDVRIVEREHESGEVWYGLFEEGKEI